MRWENLTAFPRAARSQRQRPVCAYKKRSDASTVDVFVTLLAQETMKKPIQAVIRGSFMVFLF